MATWHIEPTRENLHGHFSTDLTPILRIQSGDTVTARTLDAGWSLEGPRAIGERSPKVEPRDPELDNGHCLVGPIFMEGAQPGMTLEVQINEVQVGSWGWTVAGGWKHQVNEWFGFLEGHTTYHLWTLDGEKMVGQNQNVLEVTLRPFLGVLGMPPAAPGRHSTAPPRATGGNLDCKELIAGTTLYLPIEVEGAYFSLGDGHAVQGDGEASVTAIECPMKHVSLTLRLLDDMSLRAPRAKTKDAWITFGLNEDLQKATFQALEEMVDLISHKYEMKRLDALAMASLVVDLRITQIANGVQGVHAVLPFDAIRKTS